MCKTNLGSIEAFLNFDARICARNDAQSVMLRFWHLVHSLKFMCLEFGYFRCHGFEDMNDSVKSQNGV